MTTNIRSTNQRTITRRPKARSLVAAAALSATLAGGGTLAIMTNGVSAGSDHSTAAVPTPVGLADFMQANELTGLSPASVAPAREATYAGTMAELAAWARANNMKGLSPASMTPIDE